MTGVTTSSVAAISSSLDFVDLFDDRVVGLRQDCGGGGSGTDSGAGADASSSLAAGG